MLMFPNSSVLLILNTHARTHTRLLCTSSWWLVHTGICHCSRTDTEAKTLFCWGLGFPAGRCLESARLFSKVATAC